MDDRAAVVAANDAFYRAFEGLDLAHMEAVWLRAPYITCVHPGWGLLIGWGPVMESWQRIFTNTVSMHFELTDARAEIRGDLAWVLVVENLQSVDVDRKSEGRMQATNLFQRHEGRWCLVHHHASPIYAPVADSGPEHMH